MTTITFVRSGGGIFFPQNDGVPKVEKDPPKQADPKPPKQKLPPPVYICGTVKVQDGDIATVTVKLKGGNRDIKVKVDQPALSGPGARVCLVYQQGGTKVPEGEVQTAAGDC